MATRRVPEPEGHPGDSSSPPAPVPGLPTPVVHGITKTFGSLLALDKVSFHIRRGVLWKFENGKRSFVKKGSRDVPLPMKTWHSIAILTKGATVLASLDGEELLQYDLPAPVSGKVGLWSKTDSVTEFSDYTVTVAPATR